jgi:multisubunit Na+/H+ antiporter MnhE subunit
MAIRRFSLDINRTLLRKVMRRYPGSTESDVVRMALRLYIRLLDPKWKAKRKAKIQSFRNRIERAAMIRAAKGVTERL